MPFLGDLELVDLTDDLYETSSWKETAEIQQPKALAKDEEAAVPPLGITLGDEIPARSESPAELSEPTFAAPRVIKRSRLHKHVSHASHCNNLIAYETIASDDESRYTSVSVRIPPPLYPETAFTQQRRHNELTERSALQELLAIPGVMGNESYNDAPFTSILLDKFCVYWLYRDRRDHGLELPEYISIQDIFLKPTQTYFFDGVLRAGSREIFVRQIPFDVVTIGEFENLSAHTVGDSIWIASERSKQRSVYYRLGSPVPAYARFHEPFVWTANFIKHTVDYMSTHSTVSIHDFRAKFHTWLMRVHKQDPQFISWLRRFDSTDFMQTVACQTDCLRSQVETLGGHYSRHPIWKELLCDYIPRHPLPANQVSLTVVTPYVYSCFKEMWFGKMLRPVKPTTSFLQQFDFKWPQSQRLSTRSLRQKNVSSYAGLVSVGDVITIEPDNRAVTKWKQDNEKFWYCLVKRILPTNRASRRLHCIWLYAASQTTLSTSITAHDNELFLSDHCQDLSEEDVVNVVPVSFFSFNPPESGQLFVRQLYETEPASFKTLSQDDLTCRCHARPRTEYSAGRTVLIKSQGHLLEPVVLQEATDGLERVQVRLLPRSSIEDPTCPANELRFSNSIAAIKYKDIERTCHVRIFSSKSDIPMPYSGGGAGNCFFIVTQPSQDGFIPIIQGFDPQDASFKLNGLDLFCGSGNFAHRVADSGAIKVIYAVDLDPQAIHSYYANTICPSEVEFFCGSVDQFLLRALQGKIPGGSWIHFIIGGSPCQGFSMANQHKDSPKSLKNISLVASTVAYVDFFKPQYVLLENVTAMAKTNPKSGENVFSQMLAAFVGLGYQVQVFNLDACIEGAPQSRSRLIIALTAPGLTPLELGYSHYYASGMKGRSLGKAPNGVAFGERDFEAPRAFNVVSIAEACADLPPNQDGKSPCVAFPDHRPPVYDPYIVRQTIACIPRGLPSKESPATALMRGLIPAYIVDASPNYWKNPTKFGNASNAWARVWGKKLTPTVLATFGPADAFNGQFVHWVEDRPLSVEEARRAQQFPKHTVLLGSPLQRWHQIGNSVPGGLSLALGVALRIAVDKNVDQRLHGSTLTRTEQSVEVRHDARIKIQVPLRQQFIELDVSVENSPPPKSSTVGAEGTHAGTLTVRTTEVVQQPSRASAVGGSEGHAELDGGTTQTQSNMTRIVVIPDDSDEDDKTSDGNTQSASSDDELVLVPSPRPTEHLALQFAASSTNTHSSASEARATPDWMQINEQSPATGALTDPDTTYDDDTVATADAMMLDVDEEQDLFADEFRGTQWHQDSMDAEA